MKKNHFLIMACLFLFYAINNYIWLSMNRLPVSYDEGVHLWTSLRFVRAFIHPAHNIFYEIWHADTTHWPPLFQFTAALFNLIFGTSYIVSVMANMLFFLLLILSVYFIGKRLYNPSTGILAVIILSFYPIVYGHSRLFLLDFALTSLVAFSIYSLISADNFRILRWSVIFGISAGLGMLTKWTYIVFILPLWIYTIVVSLRNINKKQTLKNLFISTLMPILISLPQYVLGNANIEKTEFVLRCVRGGFIYKQDIYGPLEGLIKLFWKFSDMMTPLFLLLFVAFLILFHMNKRLRYKLPLTLCYLVPVLTVVIMGWRGKVRYFMPVLPYFALITSTGLSSLKNRSFKNVLLGIIFITGLAAYFNLSFNPGIGGWDDVGPPRKTDWKHAEIAKVFFRHTDRFEGYQLLIGIISGERGRDRLIRLFGNRIMNYYLANGFISSDINLGSEVTLDLRGVDWLKDNKRFVDKIHAMTGIIYISDKEEWPTLDEIKRTFGEEEIYDRLADLVNNRGSFDLIEKIGLPEGYYASIYFYRIPEIKRNALSTKVFDGKIKILLKQGDDTTKDIDIVSEFVHNRNLYRYKDAIKRCYQTSPSQIRVIYEWPDPGIIQSLLLMADPERDNAVNIEVSLQSHRDITLDDWYIDCLFSKRYKEWMRPFSKGVFKDISLFLNPDSLEPSDAIYSRPDIIGIPDNAERGLPAILFESRGAEIPIHSNVYDSDCLKNSRRIHIAADTKIRLEGGKPKDILDMKITVLPDSKLEDIIADRVKLPDGGYLNIHFFHDKIPEIRKDDLSVKILNGTIKIFYRQREITKDIGLSSEAVLNNKPYKYKEAIWDFYKISPTEIGVVFKWPDPGVIQLTTVSIDPDKKDTLTIKAELESEKDITLDGWYINSLISNQYREWVRPFSKGVFKDISPFSDPNSFEPLDLDYTGPNIIGIRENTIERLPALLFRSSDADMPMRAGVSNTNYYHNARCIYVTAASEISLRAGMPTRDVLDMSITALDDSGLKKAISEVEEALSK